MTKILLVDDEPYVLGSLMRVFDEAEYQTCCATDGALGLQQFFRWHPDVAIIDLLMPQMNGLALCKRIREVSLIPIIVLSGVKQVSELVNAFNAGADDYMTKPVHGAELIARVEARLRRSHQPPFMEPSSMYADSYLTVDFSKRQVCVGETSVSLTPVEYSLLCLFVKRSGEALSLEYLLTNVWGHEYDTFGLVKWHISNLRKKLKKARGVDSPITTVRGYGYWYKVPAE